MTVQLNHTIVWCSDQEKSSGFLAEILGRPAPTRFGPFHVVQVDNGVSLDFYQQSGKIAMQHYAFLIGEDDFDRIFERVTKRFGDKVVLDQLDFSVTAGKHVTLIGPSGSGKTTILRLLMTLTRPDEGTILVDGDYLTHERRRGMPEDI